MTTPFCSTESPTALGRISQVLKGGGIVATTKGETHYLIGSALSQEAIEKMYQIKKRTSKCIGCVCVKPTDGRAPCTQHLTRGAQISGITVAELPCLGPACNRCANNCNSRN